MLQYGNRFVMQEMNQWFLFLFSNCKWFATKIYLPMRISTQGASSLPFKRINQLGDKENLNS